MPTPRRPTMHAALLPLLLLLHAASYSVHASDGIVSNNWQCANIGQQLLFEHATVEQIYIAVSLCEGLVHPMDSGLGGGFQALLYDNRSSHYLMAREYSPWRKAFLKRPFVFGNSIGVPSVLAGYAKLLGVDHCVSRNGFTRKPCRFSANCSLPTYDIDEACVRDILSGKSASGLRQREPGVPYPRIFEEVIDLAKNGFEVSRTLRVVIDKSDQLPYFLRQTSNPNKISNLALANFLSFLAYNPVRLLDPYYAWSRRRVRDDLNTTLIILNDVRSYRSHLTDFDFFTYRASWRRALSFPFTYANQSYRFSTMPKPAGGETVAFFFRMLLTLINSPSYARFSDVQFSTLFVLFSKYSFAAKLYFRQLSKKTRDRLINDEAPYIARQLIADIDIRADENSLADYLVHETPGIPHVFGRLSLPRVVVFQVRPKKRSGAAFTSSTNRTASGLRDSESTEKFRLFYTRDQHGDDDEEDDDDDDYDDDDDDDDREDGDGHVDQAGGVGAGSRSRPTVPRRCDRDSHCVSATASNSSTGSSSSSSSLFADVLSLISEETMLRTNSLTMCDGDDEEARAENTELNELLGGSRVGACSTTSSLLQNDDVANVSAANRTASVRQHRPSNTTTPSPDPTPTLKLLMERKFEVVNFNDQLASGIDVDQMNNNLRVMAMPTEYRYQNNEYDDDDMVASLRLLQQSNASADGFPESPFGTTNVVVKRGNRCIVATSSINHSFGSLVFSQNLGIPYNNVLRDFTPHNWFLKRSRRRSAAAALSTKSGGKTKSRKKSTAGRAKSSGSSTRSSTSSGTSPTTKSTKSASTLTKSLITPLARSSEQKRGRGGGGGGGGGGKSGGGGGGGGGSHRSSSSQHKSGDGAGGGGGGGTSRKSSQPNSTSPSGYGTTSNNGTTNSRSRRSTSARRRSNVIAFANHPKPHSVPQSSMGCTILWNAKTGNPVFAIGAAGGFKITSALFNILWNYFVLGDSLEKSFSRLRLVTKLNYKTRTTEIWYEFPIESPFYRRLLREKSLIYNQLRYQDFMFLSSASRVADYPRLAYTPRFFFEHRQTLNVKYIFEAGYSAATGCSTMRNSKLTCNYDRRRGGKVYTRL